MTIALSSSALDVRRKRLLFRAARRGFREVDMIFGTFAAEALPTLSDTELDDFEALLGVQDQEIYDWFRDKTPVPSEFDTPVFAAMKALCSRKNPTWTA